MKAFWDNVIKFWPLLVGVVVVGLWAYNHDSSLARAADVKKLRTEIELIYKRFDQESQMRQQQFEDLRKNTRAEKIQERIWQLEKRYPEIVNMPESVLDQYKELTVELRKLRKEGY